MEVYIELYIFVEVPIHHNVFEESVLKFMFLGRRPQKRKQICNAVTENL